MDAFPHFITSNLCLLDLDLGQKGSQKSLVAFSAVFACGVCHVSAWVTRSRHLEFSLSRVRFGHASASSAFCSRRAFASFTHSRCAGHAAASFTRSRRCQFLQKLHFVLYFHFCMFPFHPLSHSCLRRSEITQHTNHGIEWQ